MRLKRLLVLISALVLSAFGRPASAFDNIEADAAYNGKIKTMIEAEFREGLKLLQNQAAGLSMNVREQDLAALTQHMYDKAILMGACVDQGLTIWKTLNKKLALEKFIPACVPTHLKFSEEQQKRNFLANNVPSVTKENQENYVENMRYERCLREAENHRTLPNPPYDFLKIEYGHQPADYLSMKRCYEATRTPDFLHMK